MSEKTGLDFEDLDRSLSLKQVSELFDIPSSTLRYWDKQGLVNFQRALNDYRQISPNTLLEILDVMDYRDMELSIEQIKRTPQMTVSELMCLLAEREQDLQEKILKLQQTIHKIQLKTQALQRLNQLKQTEPSIIDCQLPTIYRVNLNEPEDLKAYLTPFQAADIMHADNRDIWKGGMWVANRSGEILRPADNQPQRYLHGLLYFDRNGQDNCEQLIQLARTMGYQPQEIIHSYLSSTFDSELGLCDFHECWVALA